LSDSAALPEAASTAEINHVVAQVISAATGKVTTNISYFSERLKLAHLRLKDCQKREAVL
jgi:hypothetical protein